MAISGKHAVAISTIRVRGLTDIEAGTVFEHESSAEANSLFSADHIREATSDEADLYEGRVKQGVIPRRTLSGEGDGVVAKATGQETPVVTAEQAAAEKRAAEQAAAKEAEAKAAANKKTSGKGNEDI
jgi:hypothetical protein